MATNKGKEVPCGMTLAYSYIEGYINLITKNIDETTLEEFSAKQRIGNVYHKILVMIPRNGILPNDFVLYDSDKISRVGRLRIHINISGTIKRPYDIDIYKISFENKNVFAMISLPANIVTITKMIQDEDLMCDETDREKALDVFICSLRNMIERKDIKNVDILPISGVIPDKALCERIYYHISKNEK